MSLHQAKRVEMESQVRVLELEASLQQERVKLSALRRHHYQLAGDAEGWEITKVNYFICFLSQVDLAYKNGLICSYNFHFCLRVLS